MNSQMYLRRINTNLQSMTLRKDAGTEGAQFVLLQYGCVECGEYQTVDEPSLIVLRQNVVQSLRFHAGSEALILGLPREVLMKIRQHDLDRRGARLLPEHSMHLYLQHHPELQPTLLSAFEAINLELNRSEGVSKTLVYSWLSIILVNLWRKVGGEQVLMTARQDTRGILRQFRELVETHYRKHWTISRYVEVMEISQDRLYISCKREMEQSPQQIIHQRLVEESQLALERSSLNIAQVAELLGFKDPTHFSHFFKRHTQLSPRKYRDDKLKFSRQNRNIEALSFADWP